MVSIIHYLKLTLLFILFFDARMYQLLVDNWGNIVAFESANWLLAADPIIAGVVAFMVQLFFAWRIQIVARQWPLTMFIVICAFTTLCGGLGTGIAVAWVKSYALFANFRQIAVIWLISSTVGDTSITAALTHHLRRRKGSFVATDRLLDRIVQRKPCHILTWNQSQFVI